MISFIQEDKCVKGSLDRALASIRIDIEDHTYGPRTEVKLTDEDIEKLKKNTIGKLFYKDCVYTINIPNYQFPAPVLVSFSPIELPFVPYNKSMSNRALRDKLKRTFFRHFNFGSITEHDDKITVEVPEKGIDILKTSFLTARGVLTTEHKSGAVTIPFAYKIEIPDYIYEDVDKEIELVKKLYQETGYVGGGHDYYGKYVKYKAKYLRALTRRY